jgi:site-specific recombinase XerD
LLSEIHEQQSKRGQFVFPNPANKSGHQGDVKKSWRTLCRVANITGLRLHYLRHSFASNLVSSGASLPLIASLLGHASITTTQRYAHMFVDPQRAATERVAALVTAAGKPAAELIPLMRK